MRQVIHRQVEQHTSFVASTERRGGKNRNSNFRMSLVFMVSRHPAKMSHDAGSNMANPLSVNVLHGERVISPFQGLAAESFCLTLGCSCDCDVEGDQFCWAKRMGVFRLGGCFVFFLDF